MSISERLKLLTNDELFLAEERDFREKWDARSPAVALRFLEILCDEITSRKLEVPTEIFAAIGEAKEDQYREALPGIIREYAGLIAGNIRIFIETDDNGDVRQIAPVDGRSSICAIAIIDGHPALTAIAQENERFLMAYKSVADLELSAENVRQSVAIFRDQLRLQVVTELINKRWLFENDDELRLMKQGWRIGHGLSTEIPIYN